jgi:hypothetical protein
MVIRLMVEAFPEVVDALGQNKAAWQKIFTTCTTPHTRFGVASRIHCFMRVPLVEA